MHKSMIFSVSPELCNHHHDLVLEHFYQSKNLMLTYSHSPFPTPAPGNQ